MVLLVHQAHLDKMVTMAEMAHLASPGCQVRMLKKPNYQLNETGVSIVLQDHQVHEVNQDQKDREDCRETKVLADSLVNRVLWDHKGQEDRMDLEEIQAQLANQENRVYRLRCLDHQDHLAHQDHKDHQVSKVQLGEMAIPDDQDHVDHQVRTAKMVLQDMMVQMVIKEKQVPMDQKAVVTIVHLPEQLQAIKQFQGIIQESDLNLSLMLLVSIFQSISPFPLFSHL